ncbi:hypothetical protein P3U62_00635 [Mammaliicoccus vitulinus]|uniref:hypothetical protein n=1 Tax=Mammaliicoccus vitulinus TaxID=71237 RepID=UPI002B2636DF|nr:hypothetical protein [Mammaliicoccus vitulinus]WQK88070.1 hypothetical protein P3U62_00635 [Mammaliicoccus vitulinus]
MKQSINQVELYRKIDGNKVEEAKIHFSPLNLSYEEITNDNFQYIDLSSLENQEEIQINEFDAMWSPNDNNLIINQTLYIENHKSLFGDSGVTCIENTIGFAVHIHSKNSNFQKICRIGSFTYSDERVEIDFEYIFNPKTLRGIVNLDFFLYVKNVKNTDPVFANKTGMRLTKEDLNSLSIIVDGVGSTFPITEFSDKNGPLWKVNKNWIDASEDNFDSSQVNIALNTKHKMFRNINKSQGEANKMLMANITLIATAMIINEVINIEGNSFENEDSLIPGTILAVVSYWIETFNINTTSLFTIQNTLFEAMELETIKE